MKYIIKNTSEVDFFSTENLTREAFWNLFQPGCDEHLVLHNLRKSDAYIKELDFIAVMDNEIIGHIILTKAKIVDMDSETETLCVGPVSVLPKHQKFGIGSALLRKAIETAKELGYPSMILYGHPEYYKRFGFINAEKYSITTKDELNFDAFMALELRENSLDNIKGKFIEDTAFFTNNDELNEFEKLFPQKEKGEPKMII